MERVPHSISERMMFVDTSAFLAVVAPNDQYYPQATAILEDLQRQHYRLYTTIYVIYESHAGILSTVGAEQGRQFLHGMEDSAIDVYLPTADDERMARDIIFRYWDKDYSLCDAMSFACMQRFGTNLAFAFDDHFRQHGFYTPLGLTSWP